MHTALFTAEHSSQPVRSPQSQCLRTYLCAIPENKELRTHTHMLHPSRAGRVTVHQRIAMLMLFYKNKPRPSPVTTVTPPH